MHVDVVNREVVSVHVDDAWSRVLDVAAYSGSPVGQERRQAAIDLVNDDTMWPAWMIGFDHA